MNVVIADDSPIQLGIVRQIVARLGHTIVGEFNDGGEALRAILAHPPDLVLTDYTMIGATGGEIAAAVAKAGLATKVVLITAAGQSGVRQGAGVSSVVVKPISKTLVQHAIGKALTSPT